MQVLVLVIGPSGAAPPEDGPTIFEDCVVEDIVATTDVEIVGSVEVVGFLEVL